METSETPTQKPGPTQSLVQVGSVDVKFQLNPLARALIPEL